MRTGAAAVLLFLCAGVASANVIDAVLDALYPAQTVLVAGDVSPSLHAAGYLSNDRFDDALFDPRALGDLPAAFRFAAPEISGGNARVRYEVMTQLNDGVEKGHGVVNLRRANETWRVVSQTYDADVPSPANESPTVVGPDVKPPLPVLRAPAEYTEVARRNRVEGTVIIETLIRRSGRVTDIRVLKGLPDGLTEAAVETVRQWRYRPAVRNGVPVSVVYNLTINFKLEEPKKSGDAGVVPAPPR
jgi:TonB family protein